MRRAAALLIPALLWCWASAAQAQSPAGPIVTDGLDWSLPKSVGLSPDGALIGDPWDTPLPDYVRAVFLELDWRDVNPEAGVFDFSRIDDFLAEQAPRQIVFRINWYGACGAPQWALDELPAMDDGTLVFWTQAYARTLAPLAQALGARYGPNPRIAGIYLGFGDGQMSGPDCTSDADGWGEFWMTQDEIRLAERRFGFSPAALEQGTRRLTRLFARAFGPHSGKLAFTNIARYTSETASPYNAVVHRLADGIRAHGIGMRNGEIETWGRYIDPVFGARLTPAPGHTARLSTDEAFARTIGARYWGDENEFYGPEKYVLEYAGPYANQGYRFYVSTMRALQMRLNHNAVSVAATLALPESPWHPQALLAYQARVLGRTMENTPDAFTVLGERLVAADYLRPSLATPEVVDHGAVRIRGIERWLSEIGESTPAFRIDMPEDEQNWAQYLMPEDVDYEYAARRGARFLFDLSDDLVARRCLRACRVTLKLSYLGEAPARFFVRTATGQTQSLAITADNAIHTASFTLDTRFANSLEQGADFTVESETGALTLLMARVVFDTR